LTRDYAQLSDFLTQNGYSAIELLENAFVNEPLFSSIAEARDFRAYMERCGISIACFSVYIDIYTDTQNSLDYLKHQIDIASALGAPYFHHTIKVPIVSGDNDPTYDELIELVLPVIREVVAYAYKHDIIAIYEPQGIYYNGRGFIRFIERLRSIPGGEHVGVCFDCGNSAFVDCHPYELLKEILPYVKHVHLKDYKYLGKDDKSGVYRSLCGRKMTEVPLGEGDMRVLDSVNMLEEFGYDGYYSTEINPCAGDIGCDAGGIMAIKLIEKIEPQDKH